MGRQPEKKEIAMKPKATRKPSKELKKGKKIQHVKNLTLVCRKAAGDSKIEY
jgi:hypothetical protein